MEALHRIYEESPTDERQLVNLYDINREASNSNDYYFAPYYRRSSHTLWNKLNNLPRRDTGFLRFGRRS